MDFNSIIFPVPKVSYNIEEMKGEILWIPKNKDFTYRDKLKFNNYKTTSPNNGIRNSFPKPKYHTIDKDETGIRSRNRRSHSSYLVQKIPTICFSFDNKFKEGFTEMNQGHIPCLYISSPSFSNKILLYFHANYEDLGYTHQICNSISKSMKINVLSVEYPGYGIYKTKEKCSSEEIIKDSDIVYKFLTEIMNIEESNILLMGRCIGSGPAMFLASKYSPNSLLLISPIKSMKHAVKSIFDKAKMGWIFEKFVKDR
jgi:hypothetical protein